MYVNKGGIMIQTNGTTSRTIKAKAKRDKDSRKKSIFLIANKRINRTEV